MDRSVALKAGLVQIALVFATALILALALPKSFFEAWGWLSGPVAWLLCAAATARILQMRIRPAVTGAVVAGLPGALAVIAGVHWLGALLAAALFALWCGRLAVERELDAAVI